MSQEKSEVVVELDKAIEAGIQDDKEMTEEEFLSKQENIDGALTLAATFLKFMSDKWFTVEQLIQRTKMDRMQAIQKLQLVKMFGHARVRMGSYQDKSKHFREPMWMIAISAKGRLKAVDAVIVDCQYQLEKLNLERKSILLEIEKEQTVN